MTVGISRRGVILGLLTLSLTLPVLGQGRGGGQGQQPPLPYTDMWGSGLVTNTGGVAPGFVHFSPTHGRTTYLLNTDGEVVHTWTGADHAATSAYLLDNGNLLRTENNGAKPYRAGAGGRLREYTWDGEVVWEFVQDTEALEMHHDLMVLPNGNVIATVWGPKSQSEARQAGYADPSENGVRTDGLIEIEKTPDGGSRVVWEWYMWDHLIQDHDPFADNYGDPAEHPERIDANNNSGLRFNAVDFNPELDQIAGSLNSEIVIIDHSTTREESATGEGGHHGRGGDLLYRWGNPQTYGRGTAEDRRLFGQHDVRWVPGDGASEWRIMFYNNSVRDAAGYSEASLIDLPIDVQGRYALPLVEPFGPAELTWKYSAPDFFSPFISGAHPVANGNVFILQGADGRLFEVTPDGEVVWEYWQPFAGDAPHLGGNMGRYTTSVFRAAKIAPDHPALAGRTLEPLNPQPEVWPLP